MTEDFKEKVLAIYIPGKTSLREIALRLDSNHHRVKRAIVASDSAVVRAEPKPLTPTHKEKISKSSKGRKVTNKGRKSSTMAVYKNMASHSRFDINIKWLIQFKDLNRLKFLNQAITNRDKRYDEDAEWYRSYIEKFYDDYDFVRIYDKWIFSGKDKWKKPTLDHKTPRAKGGGNDLENLQFLTWFENRTKSDMSEEEWLVVKYNIQDYF
jgi:hypothetical protein